ncbi:echinoidin-like [Amphiura filiformis]|uniref:echinoidin-like n=1 Tax=Amphiura filiformis TaxID=82378 RepID=UPI003B2194FA
MRTNQYTTDLDLSLYDFLELHFKHTSPAPHTEKVTPVSSLKIEKKFGIKRNLALIVSLLSQIRNNTNMKSAIALLAFFAVAMAQVQHSIEHECPVFWSRFQGNCYRFFGAAKTWDNAEAHCQELFIHSAQGHLVSIHSDAELDFVLQLWQSSLIKTSQVTCTYTRTDQNPSNSILLGFNDKTTEGTFVWSDGTENDYNVWGPNQPDNSGNEDCVVFINSSTNGPIWNDIPCAWDTDLPYVCKLKATHNTGALAALLQSRGGGQQN